MKNSNGILACSEEKQKHFVLEISEHGLKKNFEPVCMSTVFIEKTA